MEALASSAFIPNFPDTYPALNTSSSCLRTSNKRIGSLKISENSVSSGLRCQALSKEAPETGSGGEGEDGKPLNNGFGLFSEEIVSSSQGNLNHYESSEKDVHEALNMDAPLTSQCGSGTRAGLFRTPISGGVQSATSAHGLPHPALAVRNLMEQARFAHLCTVMSRMHHRREGYPFGSLVDFAPDSMGHPIFSFSPLAIHTRNLLADPRCTLVVQIPGWSGLSNARVTIFGDVYPLEEHQQEWAHKQYIAKHQQGPSQQWGNFYYFRMQNISDIYFIGGFGTVAWVDVKEYEALQPDKIAVDGGEQNLKELNALFSKPLKELLSTESEVDDAALISIDSKGTDIRVRQGAQFNIQRISFEDGQSVETLEEAKAALWKLINKVRSFGTEGRKKDGPQISPSDKVYEYILFRGTDIKDLQVKSSPPAQPTPPPINNDPAIIQSHYTHPVSSSSLSAAVSGPSSDVGSHAAQLGLPGSNFQGGMPPLYQPGGNLGSWGASPPPSANGGGLAMPTMYWPGYYGPSNGLPHLHQQSLLQPPPGLAMPSSLQQPMQYPNFNAAALSTVASQLPEVPSTLLSAASSSLPNLTSTSVSPSTLPSTLPPVLSATLASQTIPSSASNKAPNPTLSASTLNASLPSLSPLATSSLDMNTTLPPNTNKSGATSGSTLPYQAVSQSTPSIVGSANSVRIDTPAPSLVTPGQLLQTGAAAVSSSQSLQAAHKDVEVVQVSSSTIDVPVPVPVAVSELQPPILPLPQRARAGQRPNGAPFQNRHSYRGRGRGRGTGSSQPVIKFTEDFDFTAMNEKFMKDEVWGHLGKSSKSHPKDREGDGKVIDEDDAEDDAESSQFEISVPVYNKDDFFDSLSCNALDNQSQSGRTKYSEQMKIDTETFGDFARHRGGRGGRGPARGGRFRGGYYGRGYGYNGRGRGRATYSHPQ